MSRSLASLIAVLLLSLSLAACGGGGEEATPTGETPGAGPSGGTVSIDLWHSETGSNSDTLGHLISRYNSSQDEVKVQAFFQGTDAEIIVKLVTSLGSGQVPAIAVVGEVDTQKMLDSGTVAPVQDFVDREGYDLSGLDEKSIQMYTVQGKLWAMPFCAGMPLLYYNKVTFREVGLDPERPPRDLEEVRDYSEKFLKRDASGNVVRSGIALDIRAWMESILAEHGDLFVDNENGHEGRATKALFDNDTGRWFFQWWHDMMDSGLAFNIGRNPTGADGFTAIASDRAAMAWSWGSALRSVLDAFKGVEGVEIGVGRLPGVPGGTGSYSFFSYGLWVFNERPKEEQEAAWKFIKWLMEPEQQAEWFAGSGYLPGSRSAVDLPAAQDVLAHYPLFQVAFDLYLNAPANPATEGTILGPYQKVREAIYRGVEEMLSGIKDPDQALDDAAAGANQAIDEYNRRVGD